MMEADETDENPEGKSNGLCTYSALRQYVSGMGVLSIIGSIWMLGYEINDQIIDDENIVPDMSFVFYTSCITFSMSLLAGAHLERLELIIPYFMLSVNLTGFYIAQVMIIMPNWNHMADPSRKLTIAGVGLGSLLISTYFLTEFMKLLSTKIADKQRSSV